MGTPYTLHLTDLCECSDSMISHLRIPLELEGSQPVAALGESVQPVIRYLPNKGGDDVSGDAVAALGESVQTVVSHLPDLGHRRVSR